MRGSRSIFAPAVLLVGAAASPSSADLWCESISGNPSVLQIVVCDDFDRYCLNPPAYPERCPNGSTPNQTPFLLNWPEVTSSVNPMKVRDEYKPNISPPEPLYADSWPFTLRYYSGANPDAGNYYWDTQHSRDVRSNIAVLDPSKDMVNGTDANPLVLEFVFHFHDEGRQYYQSQYVDLSLNAGGMLDRAPTDYIRSEDCSQVYGCGDMPGYPIICQQNNNAALSGFCPPLSSLPIHSSIAVGILAWLDTNPCHCGEDVAHAASNWHLVFFDGKQWWTLKSNLFPGGGSRTPVGSAPEPPAPECKIKEPGDFGLFNGLNRIRLTIKADVMVVEHWDRQMCKTNNQLKYDIKHWAEIPRQYKGGFNNIALGVNQGCELDVDGNCLGPRNLLGPNGHGGAAEIDSVAVYNGELGSTNEPGACCLSTGTCVEVDRTTCESDLQGRFAGNGVTCAATACCPTPFADADGDGDVDQADFAVFQSCYTSSPQPPGPGLAGICQCLDRTDLVSNDIDDDDLAAFEVCVSGPGIPVNAGCDGEM